MKPEPEEEYVLFIDESGDASMGAKDSLHYILAGCAVKEGDRHKLRTWADHIKFKYWGHTNFAFHARDMARKEGEYKIFKNKPKKYKEFVEDLEAFLLKYDLYMFYAIVDKKKTRAHKNDKGYTWDATKIYREVSDAIIKNFLCFLLMQKARGKIVVESATSEKDSSFHKSMVNYLSNGVTLTQDNGKELKIDDQTVKDTLTSISFVTKRNGDIEVQIADMLAHPGKFHYYGKKPPERIASLLKILNKQLADRIKRMDKLILRPRYLDYLNAYVVLPSDAKQDLRIEVKREKKIETKPEIVSTS